MVVVGAGSAGTVIAARATESSAREVVLLEAGPDYEPAALPNDLIDGTRNSMRSHDWGLAHRPTPSQVLFSYPRGRVIGGSSAVNTCIALRGLPHDYDEWSARGLPDWSWENCLPAFKRLEADLDRHDEWHNTAGPIPIRRHTPEELVPWQSAFLESAGSLGFPSCPDHNNPTLTGFGPHAMNKVDGVRMSAARCYLTPEVRARSNLHIVPSAVVRRVLFDNRRVSGVEVEVGGTRHVVSTRTVVLSAGAIATPAVLLRSGVGPRAVLERLGAAVVSDVPAIGAKLLDHPGSAMVFVPRPGVSDTSHPLIQSLLRYSSEGGAHRDDMQLQPGSFMHLSRFNVPLVTLMCCVGKPEGHGRLEFTSLDPAKRPRIHSDFARHPGDLAKAAEAMELAWLLARTPPMRALADFLWPSEHILSSRARILDWIPKATGSGYHPCGTVPMGSTDDPEAAVDARGRVRGVEGLHVADASIMPTIPSYNINLPTLMIGERFGEWFKSAEL